MTKYTSVQRQTIFVGNRIYDFQSLIVFFFHFHWIINRTKTSDAIKLKQGQILKRTHSYGHYGMDETSVYRVRFCHRTRCNGRTVSKVYGDRLDRNRGWPKNLKNRNRNSVSENQNGNRSVSAEQPRPSSTAARSGTRKENNNNYRPSAVDTCAREVLYALGVFIHRCHEITVENSRSRDEKNSSVPRLDETGKE